MKASEIKELTAAQLQDKVNEYKEELFNLRFQQATGQLENTARLKAVRKNIARLRTVQSQKNNEN
ncbi:50S ribosomal protein L29 [Companilactobacillus allii]|uniref:Large ribosomal subunit protein uL29 n=1 Tax=Companilactobacillus allii TaxID=1847728 RepID=A0A1P8Q049_9LACO|nr:50S ribosomal protein L29 [Companilactobacillus allii]APX71181.1 50S ribosomal protein L29 [Companilactobacillus allii]USQ68261.1 50S ribosomal protein L29 [Companilactobacillus allii]